MEDKDLKKLFKQMKEADSKAAPDFDELLTRPYTPKKQGMLISLSPLARIAAAASVVLLLLAGGRWAYQHFNAEKEPNEVIAIKEIKGDRNIMNWESDTDELMPTEAGEEDNSLGGTSIKAPISTQFVLDEDIKALLKEVPELKAEHYRYGALANWDSPTDGLMPF